MYRAEAATYDALRDLQSTSVPILFSTVRLRWLSADDRSPAHGQTFNIPGLLLESIPGVNLRRMPMILPRNTWQGICDQAVRVVHGCGDLGVLNENIRPENFVVTTQPVRWFETQDGLAPTERGNVTDYRVVILSLAQCRLKRKDESEAQWGREKWIQDEEGAIARVMRLRLGSTMDFKLEYKRSLRYLQWAPGEGE